MSANHTYTLIYIFNWILHSRRCFSFMSINVYRQYYFFNENNRVTAAEETNDDAENEVQNNAKLILPSRKWSIFRLECRVKWKHLTRTAPSVPIVINCPSSRAKGWTVPVWQFRPFSRQISNWMVQSSHSSRLPQLEPDTTWWEETKSSKGQWLRD